MLGQFARRAHGRWLARRFLTVQHGMHLIGTVYHFLPTACQPQPRWCDDSAMAAGITDHGGSSRNS
jgi:hypothetical protein